MGFGLSVAGGLLSESNIMSHETTELPCTYSAKLPLTGLATVINVSGQDPVGWQVQPQNFYVGRFVYLRSGEFEGESWGNSCFGNPYRFEAFKTTKEKRDILFCYLRHLKEKMNKYPLMRQDFLSLQGRVLGCWCLKWDGLGEFPPLCHAAYLARLVNEYWRDWAVGVRVHRSGLIEAVSSLVVETDDVVFFRRLAVNK